jgi:hypothetical protein
VKPDIRRAALLAAWLIVSGCGNVENPGGRPETAGAAPPGNAPIAGQARAASPRPAAGTLRGRVVFDGEAPSRRKAMVVKDAAVCGRIDHMDDRLVVCSTGGIQDAVISVIGVRGGKPAGSPGKEFVLDQRSCAYSPHVLILPKGDTLRILNNDGVLHNIHTFSTLNRPFNIAQPKVLKEVRRTFTECEKIPVKCDVHGWMSSWIVVVDHPYNAVTDPEGWYEIPGIPPGTYTVECWQEELGVKTMEVTIPAEGMAQTHDFVYSGETAAARID